MRKPGKTAAAVVCALAAAGALAVACGGSPDGAVATDDPARAFAPVVLLHPDERWQPMSAQTFIRNSVLWWADPPGCDDRKVAVGRDLPGQRTARYDWLVVSGLGRGPAYFRHREEASDCSLDIDRRLHANQMTRPYERSGRLKGLPLTDGYYLDLDDRALGGTGPSATAYYESRPTDVEGEPGLRLTYWMLFGAEAVQSGGPQVREGDWERADVLVTRGDDTYAPDSVVLHAGGRVRTVAWDTIERMAGAAADASHPVLSSAPGTHRLSPGSCEPCTQWQTWRDLRNARKQPWYGFGGAWGRIGADDGTTGPLGPHGHWPTSDEAASQWSER